MRRGNGGLDRTPCRLARLPVVAACRGGATAVGGGGAATLAWWLPSVPLGSRAPLAPPVDGPCWARANRRGNGQPREHGFQATAAAAAHSRRRTDGPFTNLRAHGMFRSAGSRATASGDAALSGGIMGVWRPRTATESTWRERQRLGRHRKCFLRQRRGAYGADGAAVARPRRVVRQRRRVPLQAAGVEQVWRGRRRRRPAPAGYSLP